MQVLDGEQSNHEQLIVDVINYLNAQKLLVRTQLLARQLRIPFQKKPSADSSENTALALYNQLINLFNQPTLRPFLKQHNLYSSLSKILPELKRYIDHQISMLEKMSEHDSERVFVDSCLERLDDYYNELSDHSKQLIALIEPYRAIVEEVWKCQNLRELIAFIEERLDQIPQIAIALLLDRLSFMIKFQDIDDPQYIDLMTLFPIPFQREISGFHQDKIYRKSHLYQFDETLERIVEDHQVLIINPYKNIDEPQDPVFFNLDASHLSAEKNHAVNYLDQAIRNIHTDPRFLREGSDQHLNQAGTELVIYAKKQLAEQQKKLPTLANKFKALVQHLKRAFLEVYGFDGNLITQHKAVSQEETQYYEGQIIPWGLIIASFFGLPSRPTNFDRHDHPNSESNTKPNYSPNFGWLQLLFNFIGGWVIIRDKSDWVWTNKKKIQIVFLPIKILVILPLKIILVPFKFALNILKLFTELFPAILVDLLRTTYQSLNVLAKNVYAYKTAAHLNKLPAILIGLCSFAVFLVFIALNLAKKFALTLTSPDKSANMAFSYGRKFILSKKILQSNSKSNIGFGDSRENLAFGIGVTLAFLSILSTACLWAILMPLALSALPVYFPMITQVMNSILQWPLISSCFTTIQGILMNLGTFLSTASAFGSWATSLASLMSLQVSYAVLIMSSAFAFVGAPVFATLSRITDALSNTWAEWGHEPIQKPHSPIIKPDRPLTQTPSPELKSTLSISPGVKLTKLVQIAGTTSDEASKWDRVANIRAVIALNPKSTQAPIIPSPKPDLSPHSPFAQTLEI